MKICIPTKSTMLVPNMVSDLATDVAMALIGNVLPGKGCTRWFCATEACCCWLRVSCVVQTHMSPNSFHYLLLLQCNRLQVLVLQRNQFQSRVVETLSPTHC